MTASLSSWKKGDSKKLIVYLTAGYPDAETFVAVAKACADAGVDALEIGVPFSDPSADGPVIQYTSQAAIDAGIDSLETVAELTKKVSDETGLPLIWMGYLNPILHFGIDQTLDLARASGVQGAIIPDLPLEEAADFMAASERVQESSGDKFHWIPLLAGTTRQNRAEKMLQAASGFAYYVSVKGVTGARTSYPEGWHEPLDAFRATSDTPICVGFGVSGPELAQECVRHSDGVIIGSKVLNIVREAHEKGQDAAAAVGLFLADIRSAIDAV